MNWYWYALIAFGVIALLMLLAMCKVASDADKLSERLEAQLWEDATIADWEKFDEQLNELETESGGIIDEADLEAWEAAHGIDSSNAPRYANGHRKSVPCGYIMDKLLDENERWDKCIFCDKPVIVKSEMLNGEAIEVFECQHCGEEYMTAVKKW